MTKKTLLILSLLLVMIFVFAGCSKESFKTEGLKVENMSGELTSNGGVSVGYKGYTYFINGDVASYSVENTYGQVKYGAVCRVKTSQLTDETFRNREFGTDEYAEVEILAPKAVYTTATANGEANGLYIFNDRLYYTSPSTTKDSEGAKLTGYLDIFSVKLDGTDMQRLFTVDANTYDMMLAADGESVYAVYVKSGKLVTVELTAAKPAETTVVSSVSEYKFIVNKGVVVYSVSVEEEGHEGHDHNTCNTLGVYRVGEDNGTDLISGEHADGQDLSYDVVMTIVTVTENNVYFTVEEDVAGRNGLYRIALNTNGKAFANGDATKVNGENILESGVIYEKDGQENIIFYNTNEKHLQYFDGANYKDMFYTTSAPTLVKVVNGKLFYTTSAGLKFISVEDYIAAGFNGTNAREEDVKVVTARTAVTSSWLTYDFYGDYALYLAKTDDGDVYLYYTDFNDNEQSNKSEYFIGIFVDVTATA